jgi:hypothetical protein
MATLYAAGLTVVGQSYSIDWHVVAGGGGTSTGGDYTLSGTIGQAEAGETLSGGAYTLQGGFWTGATGAASGEAPRLFIQIHELGVAVSWLPATPGFVLEMSGELSAGEWAPAPEGNPVLLPTTERAIFYRLRRN